MSLSEPLSDPFPVSPKGKHRRPQAFLPADITVSSPCRFPPPAGSLPLQLPSPCRFLPPADTHQRPRSQSPPMAGQISASPLGGPGQDRGPSPRLSLPSQRDGHAHTSHGCERTVSRQPGDRGKKEAAPELGRAAAAPAHPAPQHTSSAVEASVPGFLSHLLEHRQHL